MLTYEPEEGLGDSIAYPISVPFLRSLPIRLSSVLNSRFKGPSAKLREFYEDNWRPWVNRRGGKEIRIKRKRNEKNHSR